MEKKVLASGNLGTIGSYEVALDAGELKASIGIHAIDLAIAGLEQTKTLIPGHWDDLAIDLAIAKLNELKNP